MTSNDVASVICITFDPSSRGGGGSGGFGGSSGGGGGSKPAGPSKGLVLGRGLHSSTFQLNLSRF